MPKTAEPPARLDTPDVPPKTRYREEWLERAMTLARDLFKRAGYDVPANIRVTCGWPSVNPLGARSRRIGECWASTCSSDEHFEILISPNLDDGIRVLGVLIHEIVHATVGLEHGHKKPFADCARAVGLTGKMTATTETEELQRWCATAITKTLGRYPHAKLDGKSGGSKKQATRLLKMECEQCGCVIRTTNKWQEQHGTEWPCPCGGKLRAQ